MPSHNHAAGAGEEFPVHGFEGTTAWRNHSTQKGQGHFALTNVRGGN